jgi:hypothetical protein
VGHIVTTGLYRGEDRINERKEKALAYFIGHAASMAVILIVGLFNDAASAAEVIRPVTSNEIGESRKIIGYVFGECGRSLF